MRIQHNIMAMNAYRNYNTNTSALSKNLEKLSSGYKINRAGDDAAGLAISEKMRAQITGLNAAQKNVKDGISLVKTAEGAMQEIQDMLNRMDYLATQSANGTYDNEVDRANLQKEVDQLKSEINRIADSANFNGIKLLNGDLDSASAAAKASAVSNITTSEYSAGGASPAFEATYVTNRPEAATTVGYAKFDVSLDDIKITKNTDGVAANSHTFTLNVGGTEIKIDGTTTGKLAGNADASAADIVTAIIQNGKAGVKEDGTTAATAQGDVAKLGTGAGDMVEIDGNIYKMTASANGKGITFTQMNKPADGTVINPNYEVSFSAKPDGTAGKGGKVSGTVNDHVQVTSQGVGIGASHQAQVDVTIDFSKIKNGDKLTVGNKTYVFRFGESATSSLATGNEVDVDLHDILKTEADLADEDKLNQAMVKMTEAMDAAGTGNPTWSVGNQGVNGTVGTLTFQSKSTYLDDTNGATENATNAIGGKVGNGKCDMRTEASVMKQFYSESQAANASVSFEVDVTKIQKGQQFVINGQKFEFTDAAVADDKDAVAINLSALGDIDGGKLLPSQTADVMAAIKTAVSAELGTTGFDVAIDGNKLTITSKDLSNTSKIKENKIAAEVSIPGTATNGGLTLQIGDTADAYNQLQVSIGDMHTKALGIDGLDISNITGAQNGIQVIKDAINSVSSVRGTLGATQNRLEHTANNLSVMAENIQDAESTIRDTDVAEEMMAYTKNNILIQSAQAMLAQANAVPQGVLQLLG